MKKLLLLCLMTVLLWSMTGTAQAKLPVHAETDVTAEAYLPDIAIDVSVPISGEVQINPYRFPVKVGPEIQNDQIVCGTFSIDNRSVVPLRVNVEVYGDIKTTSEMRLRSESTVGTGARTKDTFMYIEFKAVSNPNSVKWADEFDEDLHLVVRDITKTRKNIAIIGAADQEKHYGAFRLTGDCVEEPREPWTELDGVSVEIIFTFEPLPVGTEIP